MPGLLIITLLKVDPFVSFTHTGEPSSGALFLSGLGVGVAHAGVGWRGVDVLVRPYVVVVPHGVNLPLLFPLSLERVPAFDRILDIMVRPQPIVTHMVGIIPFDTLPAPILLFIIILLIMQRRFQVINRPNGRIQIVNISVDLLDWRDGGIRYVIIVSGGR